MMRLRILFTLAIVCSLRAGYAQSTTDTRPVVGVAQFTCQEESPYTHLVTEKVVEMLTNTRRFQVVDRTSIDKVQAELELQKSEAFIDSENLAEQGVAVAAEKMITGEIVKIPVYRITNSDGSTRGFKASVAFQMKVVDVETGLSSEATSFEGKASKEHLSPESAVTAAMASLQDDIYEYFRVNFPATAEIKKILEEKNGTAQLVLLSAGNKQGVRVGDKFTVETIEYLEGEVLPTTVGEVVVKELTGEAFCKCTCDKSVGTAICDQFKAGGKMRCSLVIKK